MQTASSKWTYFKLCWGVIDNFQLSQSWKLQNKATAITSILRGFGSDQKINRSQRDQCIINNSFLAVGTIVIERMTVSTSTEAVLLHSSNK